MIMVLMWSRTVGTAFRQEKCGQRMNPIKIRADADDLAPLFFLTHKPDTGQNFHVMRKCRTGDARSFAKFTDA